MVLKYPNPMMVPAHKVETEALGGKGSVANVK